MAATTTTEEKKKTPGLEAISRLDGHGTYVVKSNDFSLDVHIGSHYYITMKSGTIDGHTIEEHTIVRLPIQNTIIFEHIENRGSVISLEPAEGSSLEDL